jgi:hypothetical protein
MNWIKKIFNLNNKETLIYSLEKIYNDLKIKNSDKDEHWLLANTWMARYGNWEVSKQKGPEWIRYVAYKDTFQFSLLDFPKSIRAFSLFMVYKELGEAEAVSVMEEANQLMTEILKIQMQPNLIDEYKVRNPFTWSEIHAEKEEAKYSLLYFLKASDHLNKHPEERERVIKEMEDL